MSVKQLKRQLYAAICSVLVTVLAFGTCTYAWIVNNTQTTATEVSVTSTVSYSLLIKRAVEGAIYSTSTPLMGNTTLVPVSTLGERVQSTTTLPAPDSSEVQKNDIRFVNNNEWDESGRVKTFTEVGKKSTTTINDGVDVYSSTYYYEDSVYLKAGQSSCIYFDNLATGVYDETNDNLISFGDITDEEQVALFKTMRVGLLVTQDEGKSTEKTNFFVYQFNDSVLSPASTSTTIDFSTKDVDGISYAAGATGGVGSLETYVCNLKDGKVPLITDCMADGRSDGLSVVYNTGNKISQPIASVNANEEVKVDIYFWMEGCDHDTTAGNTELFNTTITGIQFGFCLGIPN